MPPASATPESAPSAEGQGGTPFPGVTLDLAVDDRPASVVVPYGYTPATPTGLLVVLHGYTDLAENAFHMLQLPAAVAAEGLLVALPQGTRDRAGDSYWNASRACCNFYGAEVDDSTYLSHLINAVQTSYAIDSDRVYVIGHSNGGFMAYRLACEHADQVTAVVSVAGAMDADGTCDPSRPVSVLEVHGDSDRSVRFAGGDVNGVPYTSARQTVGRWLALDGCTTDVSTTDASIDASDASLGEDLTAESWRDCRAGAEVALWTIAGGTHSPNFTALFGQEVVDWLGRQSRA